MLIRKADVDLSPTDLVSDCERGVKAIVLDDGTASLRRADGADIRHTQGVAGVVATEVLEEGDTDPAVTCQKLQRK